MALLPKPRRFRAVSLFSGAMGLDIGLERSGWFEVLAAVEVEPVFCDTIRRNRDAGRTTNSDMKIYQGDIRKLDPHKVMSDCGLEPGELDLLVGGPPCQAFSTAGRRGALADPRGELLWQFLRFVEVLKPKFFLMENVRGLISAAIRHRPIKERPEKGGPPLAEDETPGSVVRLWVSDLRERCGDYRVDCFEVNAVNYGAPQLRERLLFIGNRFNHLAEFPNPTHGHIDGSSQLTFSDPSQLLPYRTLGDVIRGLEEELPVIMDFSPRKKHYLSLVPPGGNWRTLPESIQKESMGKAWYAKGGRSGWWRRLSYDLPCPTLVTAPNHASTSLCHPEELRALSLREYGLIQEFPRDWEFSGSPQQQYAQVGNAVPVRLGIVSGDLIAEHLGNINTNCNASLDAFRVVYIQSHVRTRQWYKDGKQFVWGEDDSSDMQYAAPKTIRKQRNIWGNQEVRESTAD